MNWLHTARAPRLFRVASFTTFVLFVHAVAAQQPKPVVETAAAASSSPRELTLAVTVTDRNGHYITGLTKDEFSVFDGDSQREITKFEVGNEPASVGVLFDISSSMRAGRQNLVESARLAFVRFVRSASPQNEYFLWAFDKTDIELTGWTHDAAAINEGLNKIAPATIPKQGSGGTAIYDTCVAALKKLTSGSHRRRVLLILTDGNPDNASRQAEFKNLKREVREAEALVYPIAIIDPMTQVLDAQGGSELNELATLSGGRAFFVNRVAELNGIAERIAEELNRQYVIGFEPTNAAKKGEWNKVRIKLKKPSYFKDSLYTRSREGYYSPE